MLIKCKNPDLYRAWIAYLCRQEDGTQYLGSDEMWGPNSLKIDRRRRIAEANEY